jgi:hypothetical protein
MRNEISEKMGKGALSAKLYSGAVLQCCGVAVGKAKKVRG